MIYSTSFTKTINSRLFRITSLLLVFFMMSGIVVGAGTVPPSKIVWKLSFLESKDFTTPREACEFAGKEKHKDDGFILFMVDIHGGTATCDFRHKDNNNFGASLTISREIFCATNSDAHDFANDPNPQCACNGGFKASGGQCIAENAPDPEKSLGNNSTDTNASSCQEGQFCGNPISNTTGNKYEAEEDYLGTGPFPLRLTRHYNSQSTPNPKKVGIFGAKWSDDFSGSIQHDTLNPTEAKVIKPNGQVLTFTLTNDVWSGGVDVLSRLTEKKVAGKTESWSYTTGEDNTEEYDQAGRLTKITNRAGLTQTLSYAANRLASVSDPFGRTLKFTFGANNRIATVTDPAKKMYTYGYDAVNNLKSVTYPDGKNRHYLYENASFPHAMTGLIDENGVRFATWTYDDQGRAKTSEHAGGADKTTLDIDTVNGESKVTDALGRVRSFKYQTLFGAARTEQAKKPSPQGGDGATATSEWEYDDNGNISSFIDYKGAQTTYSYDTARNLETSRTEAAGTADKRTISTEWHDTWRLPTRIAEAKRIITNVYDATGAACGAKGELCSKSIQPTTDTNGSLGFGATLTGNARTWTYKYNLFGQITEINGPRTNVNDITKFDYTNGNLTQITDALSHITKLSEYDAHGLPRKIVDPNGLVTQFEYDFRQRLISRKLGNEQTIYGYDDAGQLKKLTQPDASFLEFTYDQAHRLTEIKDSLGNKIVYTLDNVGNRKIEEVFDPVAFLRGNRKREFDALDRLSKLIGARSQTTLFEYDDEDNLTRTTDPLGTETNQAFDALNRLRESTADVQKISYDYDAIDNLIKIIDPLDHSTAYTVNGLGDNEVTNSPDTGNMQNSYDDAGNLKMTVDARGKQVEYGYDALNRVTSIKYPEATITFSYDQGTNGIGHLTQMTDASGDTGNTTWTYDAHGRVKSKNLTVKALSLTTSYVYDSAGRLETETYPSSQVLKYFYLNGNITQVTLNGVPLMSGIHFHPFGPADTWTWGNGATYWRLYDQDGNPRQYDLSGFSRQLTYDPADRIKDFVDVGINLRTIFDYDVLHRLTEVTDPSGQKKTYTYDENGNRLSLTNGEQTISYDYSPDNNKLTSITEAEPKALQYDNVGNLEFDGGNQFSHDGRRRLIQTTVGQDVFHYGINGLGQRVSKLKGEAPDLQSGSYFIYDESGHLQGEYDLHGNPVQEYVWLDDQPVAVLSGGQPFYIYPDHLNTPRAIADSSKKIVWRWEGEPFGNTPAQDDPDADGVVFTFNLRFPGQYFDSETGLHYNYFRDYNPATGRYIQSDPIGLRGGINTYNYVESNPLISYDSEGLIANDKPDVLLHNIFNKNSKGPKLGTKYRGYDRSSKSIQKLIARSLRNWGGPGPKPDASDVDIGHRSSFVTLRPGQVSGLKIQCSSENRSIGATKEKKLANQLREKSEEEGLDPHDPSNPFFTRRPGNK